MGQLSCKMRLHVHVATIATLQCINGAFLKEVHIQHHPFESTPDGPAFLFEENRADHLSIYSFKQCGMELLWESQRI